MRTYTKIYRYVLAGVFLFLLGVSCDPDDNDKKESNEKDSINETTIEEGRLLQITALYDNEIVPQQAEHIALTTALHESATAFSSDANASTLSALKTAWENAFLQWKQMEYYNMGIIKSSSIHARIHEWPPVDEGRIEAYIAEGTTINNAYINSKGTSTKGYGAIEYLLYQDDEAETLLDFTSNANAEKRMAFLVALTENLNEKAGELQGLWETYEAAFKSELGTGVNGSQNQIVNAIITGLETIKLQKTGQMEGVITDASGMEAFYSEMSKAAVANNLLALQAAYTGDFSSEEGYGMEEFVDEVLGKADLNTNSINAFTHTLAALEAINGTLEDAVVNNTPELVAFREALTALIVWFKSDLASAANIVVTFSDNDGD